MPTPLTSLATTVTGLRRVRSGSATPEQLRLAMNLYPPLLFAGVKVDRITHDWWAADVHLKHLPLTRNFMGTQYGGSLYTMCDPWWALLLIHRLGTDYVVWDRKAEITYVAPGRSRVFGRFEVGDDDVAAVREETAPGGRCLRWFSTALVDRSGSTVARISKQVYVRRR